LLKIVSCCAKIVIEENREDNNYWLPIHPLKHTTLKNSKQPFQYISKKLALNKILSGAEDSKLVP